MNLPTNREPWKQPKQASGVVINTLSTCATKVCYPFMKTQ